MSGLGRFGARRMVAVGAAVALTSGLASVGLLTAVAGPAAALPSNCSQSGGKVTCTFGFTGGTQTWTAPVGVTSAVFDVQGAQGGSDLQGDFINAPGGMGGEATATVTVTAGSTVTLVVGGQGHWTQQSGHGASAGSVGPNAGGFNGGGTAIADPGKFLGAGAGGGGASDVRIGGTALSNRVIVGGGGGGGGGCSSRAGGASGGGGGGLTGVNGKTCLGVGGAGGNQDGSAGSGQLGVGGASDVSGGGGGGGFYGGGGGSFAGGGGGSGHGPTGTTFVSGVRSGDGVITVSYSAPPPTITSPANGAIYTRNQPVTSSFTCADVAGGPGIKSCVDQNNKASGSAVDTSTLGTHTFTVAATNTNALVGTGTATYTVVDNDLALSQLPNITTSATGPNGATVTYDLPVVTDPYDTTVHTPLCNPASGATFAVGTTTVTCTVTDADDTNSPVSTSFSVTVNAVGTTIALSSSSNPSQSGKPVTFTAKVTPKAGTMTPTGTVQFIIDGTPSFGAGHLSSGTATSPAITLGAGSHAVVANYIPDTASLTGSSATLQPTQIATKGKCADLADCNLTGLDLSNANLSGLDLTKTNFTHANLTGADLSMSNLTHAKFTEVTATGANFSGAVLTEANLTGAKWSGVNLSGANLSDANLTHVDLTSANLSRATFTSANLTDADLRGATTTGATFTRVKWSNATCPDGTQSKHNSAKSCTGHL